MDLLDRTRTALGARWRATESIAHLARELGMRAYLVGGCVRDLLLGIPLRDVDLAIDGDAVSLTVEAETRLGGQGTTHPHFMTGRWVSRSGHPIDLATTRAESYSAPAALPEVRAADISTDLKRRDFTINAMALELATSEAMLVDPHGGQADLDAGLLRVLHEQSFRDDPTRAWRGARFAVRFGLQLEPVTGKALKSALEENVMARLSHARLGSEIEDVFAERDSVEILARLSAWNVGRGLAGHVRDQPALCARIASLEPLVKELTGELQGPPVGADAKWVLLAAHWAGADRSACPQLVPGDGTRARLWTQGPQRIAAARAEIARLDARSAHARALENLSEGECLALWALYEDERTRRAVCWWLSQGQHVRSAIGSERLRTEGLEPGPALGAALRAAQDAAWDGLDEAAQLEFALSTGRRSLDGLT